MTEKRLQVIATGNVDGNRKVANSLRKTRREEMQARMDRLWLEDPDQFNPERNAINRERLKLTLELLHRHMNIQGQKVADLGCGGGELTREYRNQGAISVHALDISSNALKKLRDGNMERITAYQECLPATTLPDDGYGLVASTDVIAFLPLEDYRLYFAELARIVKSDGWVLCSTPLDIDTINPLEPFVKLAETEFEFHEWVLSYHLCSIRLHHFWEAPAKFYKGYKDPSFRKREMDARKKYGRAWFKFNTTPILAHFWKGISWLTDPIASFFRQNETILAWMERICRLFWSENGISHAIFIGKRRPLIFPLPQNEIPRERKHKREVWE